jgi:hypothetical protein
MVLPQKSCRGLLLLPPSFFFAAFCVVRRLFDEETAENLPHNMKKGRSSEKSRPSILFS